MVDRPRQGEFDLITRFFKPLSRAAPGAPGVQDLRTFALGNDGALLTPAAGSGLVVTKDLMVAGVHYPADEEPSIVARRLLRVNLSDLAAMGATACGYALGLALPRGVADTWVADFCAGLARDQAHFGVVLIGGDTVATEGPAVLSLTAFGTVADGAVLTRSGAGEGDDIYVSGTIGDGALGLRVVGGGLSSLAPEDRAALGAAPGAAPGGLATCAIDVSDGLVADLGHLCAESGVAARLTADAVPLSGPARRALAGAEVEIAALVTGGDDYELLFCAPRPERGAVEALGRSLGLAVTRIGMTVPGQGVTVVGADGRPLPLSRAGYTHF